LPSMSVNPSSVPSNVPSTAPIEKPSSLPSNFHPCFRQMNQVSSRVRSQAIIHLTSLLASQAIGLTWSLLANLYIFPVL
jgi:hypothetical protein